MSTNASKMEFTGTERFSIERCLGAGGFGAVYQAYDKDRHARVALKTLNINNANALYRFKKEFRALTGIVHPNLVTLYELISDGEQWFFTMELVEGTNFFEYVSLVSDETVDVTSRDSDANLDPNTTIESQQPQPIRTTFPFDQDRLRNCLAQLASGLIVLHNAGKIHRDIKPSNIMITNDGRVVILDFGLITEIDPDNPELSIDLVGTPNYMSPEQGVGQATTPASDWYSVGVMLYEALTGRLPFSGKTFQVISIKQTSDPPPLRNFVLDLPQDLEQLCLELLSRDPSKRPSGTDILKRLDSTEQVISSFSQQTELAGRQQHLAVLKKSFAKTKEGNTVFVSVHGSSGMGKSTLIRHFIEDLQRNYPKVVILSGRCYEQESLPYKALDNLIDALTRYLRSLPNTMVETLMPYDILALARLFPVLRQIEAVSGAQRKVLKIPDVQELRRRAFAALRELLMRLADRISLVLFIDDLQWGDIDSAALLSELLRPPDPPSLLIIASHRSEEAQTSTLLQALLPLLKAFDGLIFQELVVAELEQSEATKLASSLLTKNYSPELATAIAQESRGNPFFINELVRYYQTNDVLSTAPKLISLSEVLQARITNLPKDARQLLEILAIAGAPLDIELARQAAKLADSLPTILATLRAGNLIRTRNIKEKEEIELYHDRIRETIFNNLSLTTNQSHHLSLAIVLESTKGTDPEQLAIHFQEAKVLEKAFEYSVLAADNAVEALAFDHAARLYQLAIEINANNPPVEASIRDLANKHKTLYTKLADALVRAGHGADAAKAYLKAAEHANSIEKLNLQRQAAEQFLYSGHFDQGLPILNQVLNDIGIKLAKSRVKALVSIILRKIYLKIRGLKFKERDESQISPSELIQLDACWSMCSGLAMVDVIIAVDFHMKHLLQALELGEPYRIARALAQEIAYSVGQRTSNKQYIDKLLDTISSINKTIQDPQITVLSFFSSAIAGLFLGQWRKSKENCISAEKICREQCTGIFRELARVQIYKLKAMLMLGELNEISSSLPALLNEAQERGDFYLDINLRTRVSYCIMLAEDQPENAKQEVKEAISRWSIEGFQIQHYFALIAEGEILLYQNQPLLALQIINEKWKELEKSNILQFSFANVEALFLRARCALALAYQDKSFLASAKRDAEEIKKEKADWANAFANLIYAQIELISGNKSKAIELLSLAEKGFEAHETFLYCIATRRQRGLLLASEAGNQLVKEAETWMASQKIKNFNAMTLMLISAK